jgi:dienelactone hydrolase
MPLSSLVAPNAGTPLALHLHRPAGDPADPLPAVIVMGSWLTVKEQMADLYAAVLARRGYAAFTFDFSGFGASGGSVRQTEMPTRKIADLQAVVRFVTSLSTVAPGGPGVLAVCAGAQYALAALAAGTPIASFASVAGWFHDARSVAAFYGGADGLAARLDRADAAARRFLTDGELSTVPAYAAGDERAGMFTEMDYYANPARGAVPAWRNEMTELTWAHWLTFDGLGPAAAVETPTLLVHSDGCVFPDHVRSIATAMPGRPALVWGEGEQTDFYDRPAAVDFALDAADEHFRRTLGGAR